MEMKDEILAGIQQNMRIESVRGEAQPDAPYGPGPKAALEDATKEAGAGDIVLICGSLYILGDAIRFIEDKEMEAAKEKK